MRKIVVKVPNNYCQEKNRFCIGLTYTIDYRCRLFPSKSGIYPKIVDFKPCKACIKATLDEEFCEGYYVKPKN